MSVPCLPGSKRATIQLMHRFDRVVSSPKSALAKQAPFNDESERNRRR